MRTTRPYTYLGTVQGMCRECRAIVPCRVLEENGAVYQERLCPQCGKSRARIADSSLHRARRVLGTRRARPRIAGALEGAPCLRAVLFPLRPAAVARRHPRPPTGSASWGSRPTAISASP